MDVEPVARRSCTRRRGNSGGNRRGGPAGGSRPRTGTRRRRRRSPRRSASSSPRHEVWSLRVGRDVRRRIDDGSADSVRSAVLPRIDRRVGRHGTFRTCRGMLPDGRVDRARGGARPFGAGGAEQPRPCRRSDRPVRDAASGKPLDHGAGRCSSTVDTPPTWGPASARSRSRPPRSVASLATSTGSAGLLARPRTCSSGGRALGSGHLTLSAPDRRDPPARRAAQVVVYTSRRGTADDRRRPLPEWADAPLVEPELVVVRCRARRGGPTAARAAGLQCTLACTAQIRRCRCPRAARG